MILRRKLTITLDSPYLTRGNRVGVFGIDAPLARNAAGTLYLPGTLVVGRLAEAFRQLGEAGVVASAYRSDLDTLFAHVSAGNDATNSGRTPRRRLFVGDLLLKENKHETSGTRSRVALNPVSGVVTEGALQVIEAPFETGEKLVFTGEIRLLAIAEEGKAAFGRIAKALAWITQFGSNRTTGFGVNVAASLGQPGVAHPVQGQIANDAHEFRLRLRFKDLLHVGDLRSSGNSYTSSAVVPGGAIKGAIATQILCGKSGYLTDNAASMPEFKLLAEQFSKLRISHAFPIVSDTKPNSSRPRRIPMSWVTSKGRLYDTALIADPTAPVIIEGEAAKFAPDWKPPALEQAATSAGWSEPSTELRLRTQIDPIHRAAQESRLFAISYRRTDMHDWVADVDFTGDAKDMATVFTQLRAALSEGLIGIGRGGAFAEVIIEPRPTPPGAEKGNVIMTLQTPALLRRPCASGDVDLTPAYAAAFLELGITAKLKAIFVRERLRGAQFFAARSKAPYRPWLLTEAGSVFVFSDVADIMPFKSHLEVPMKTLAFYGHSKDGWKNCPYLPENGYGEVAFGPLDSVGAPPMDAL